MEEFDKGRNEFVPTIEIPRERYDALVRAEVTVNVLCSALREFGLGGYQIDTVLKTLFPCAIKKKEETDA